MEDKVKNIVEKAKNTAVVIGRSTAQLFEKAGEKTAEIIDNTKAGVAVYELEKEINELYRQIGKSIYDSTKNDMPVERFDDMIETVDMKLDEIKQLKKAEEEKANRQTACPNPECGQPVSKEDNFCPKCGAVL